ncbi:hypothetical protein PC116_g20382 [Phytophthora cactorum]|nr:hypothetical protein PC116_g20382 [Phytophthora cactorum]
MAAWCSITESVKTALGARTSMVFGSETTYVLHAP